MTEHQWLTSTAPRIMLLWLMGKFVGDTGLPPKPSDRKLQLFIAAAGCEQCRVNTIGLTFDRVADYVAIASCHSLAFKASVLRDIFGNPHQPLTLPAGPPVPCEVFCRTKVKRRIDELLTGGPIGDGIGPRRAADVIAKEFGFRHDPYDIHKMWRRGQPWGDPCPTCKPGPCPWLTSDVLSVAHAVYDNPREDGTLDPARLAVLSDALEDAGCPSYVRCELCGGKGGRMLKATDKVRSAPGECRACRLLGRVPHPLLAHLRGPQSHYRGCHVIDTLLGLS